MKKNGPIIRIIACEVFRPVLEHLKLDERHPGLRTTYLPANLHMGPRRLREYIRRRIRSSQEKRNEEIICLYGDCFPGIDGFCAHYRIRKVPGAHCYEMLLGSNTFRQLIEDNAGTFFAEKELITHFDDFCVTPLELNDEEMRRECFRHYRKLLYVRQPTDPDLTFRAGEQASFLGLSLDVRDADYSDLETKLETLIWEMQQ